MTIKQNRYYEIILAPHISEKAVKAADKHGQYTFKVGESATKGEIKDAIEFLFSTKVESVRVLNTKSKKKIFKGRVGTKKAWKKAYITLVSGQKLDIAGMQQ